MQYKLSENGKSYYLTGYVGGDADEINVPSHYNGKPVTKVLDAFKYNSSAHIKKITLPEQLKTIEGGAFEDCGNLREVYFNAIDCKAIVE